MSDYPTAPEPADDDPLATSWGDFGLQGQHVTPDGEIVDAEVIEGPAQPVTPTVLPLAFDGPEGARQHLPAIIAGDGAEAVRWFRDPDAVRTLSREAGKALLAQVRQLATDARGRRAEGRPTAAVLAPELTLMADAHDTLVAIQGVFGDAAKEARAIAGEVAHELADDPRRGTTSVRVGSATGEDVKVTRTQPTKMQVREGDVVDVIVASLLDTFESSGITEEEADQYALGAWSVAYARGARDAIALYRELAATHTFKSTALDDFGRRLEAAEQDALAIRLGHAYGRVSHGNAQVKIERVPAKDAGDE